MAAVSGPRLAGPYLDDDEDPESSRWIHRDKLARIEIEEMQRAGIYIRSDQRALIRAPEKRDRSREPAVDAIADGDPASNPAPNGFYGTAAAAVDIDLSTPVARPSQEVPTLRQRRPSQENHRLEHAEEEPFTFELRRPEEVAEHTQDRGGERWASAHRRPLRKVSWSKIPVFKTSPAPVPQDYIEKHTPTNRTRAGRWGSVDEDSIAYRKARDRSQSVGSQILLDHDADDGGRSRTPTGPRIASQASPPSAGRPSSSSHHHPRTSVHREGSTANKTRPRPAPAKDSPSQRPGTRSGEMGPPHPINRPEGDAPWLATMYKPDPRLPQEQQLIPTVAKRLQLEQSEREGKRASRTRFESDDNQLDRAYEPDPVRSYSLPIETGTETETETETETGPKRPEWPLKSPTTPVATKGGTGGRDHSQKRRPDDDDDDDIFPGRGDPPQTKRVPNMPPPPIEPLRVHAPEDEKEDKGMCRCCMIM